MRRSLIVVVTLSTAIVVAVGWTDPSPAEGLVVTAQSSWTDTTGPTTHVVGTLRNDSSTAVDSIEARLSLEDAAGEPISTMSIAPLTGVLDPGDSSPFLAVFASPAGYDHAEVSLTWSPASPRADRELTVAPKDGECSGRVVTGSVRNGGAAGSAVEVAVEFFAADGTLVDVASTVTSGPAYETAPTFAVWRDAGAPPCDHYRVLASAPVVESALQVGRRGRGDGLVVAAKFLCGAVCTGRFPVASAVTLTAVSDPGSVFRGWSGACTGRAFTCTVVMNGPQRVTAAFARAPTPPPTEAPIWSDVDRFISERSGHVGIAVFDFDSGTTFTYQPDRRFLAASIAKVQILATALWRAQSLGRSLTSAEREDAVPMIEESNNGAATRLMRVAGGAAAIQRFDDLIPMTHTTVKDYWALTQTTAADNVQLVRRLVAPNKVLTDASRTYALSLMEDVIPWQRFGISGGVPSGCTVALKNGWWGSEKGPWTINSIGWVKGRGRNYAIAVLTQGNPSMDYGIDTIEGISARVFAHLA